MKKEIQIPFTGFYETFAGEFVERELLNSFVGEMGIDTSERNIDEVTDLTESEYTDFQNYSYKNNNDEEVRYANRYCEVFFDELDNKLPYGVKIPFIASDVEVSRPAFYNFVTDRIFCKVDLKDLLELYKLTDKEKLAQTIKDEFTSRDGFISHYSNDINNEEWSDPENFDHNQWLTVFKTWIDDDIISEISCGMSF